MKPGRELDKLVAKAIGQVRVGDCPLDDNCPGRYEPQLGPWPCLPPYSTNVSAAMAAWEWLEQNHSWGWQVFPSLCESPISKAPAVILLGAVRDMPYIGILREITGDTYPHAICLAVLDSIKSKR